MYVYAFIKKVLSFNWQPAPPYTAVLPPEIIPLLRKGSKPGDMSGGEVDGGDE